MKNILCVVIAMIALVATACSSATPITPQPMPATPEHVATRAENTPVAQSVSPIPKSTPTTAFNPYPYTTPLPPPTPTILDGIYTRNVIFEGTPTPCRRCAPYRAEGGSWTLSLKAGVFRVSHSGTNFQGVGSFTVSDDRIVFFNDPHCHLGTGNYTWEMEGRSLNLKLVNDGCAFGLRAKNLTGGTWVREADGEGRKIDPCQPPSVEAAISGHWPVPAGCQPAQFPCSAVADMPAAECEALDAFYHSTHGPRWKFNPPNLKRLPASGYDF